MSLLGAINIGVSGMNAYSDGLQIISNNVSNLNTLGYKAETVNFNDIYNSGGGGLTYLGADAGSTGDGVRIDPKRTDFSQGTLQQTGNALDLALKGSGFLVLQSDGQTYYARTGSFAVGQDGYIALQGTPAGTSYHLAVLNSSNQATPVNVTADRTNPPVATANVVLGDNLSSSATTATVSNVTVYDSTGASHTWILTLTPATTGGVTGEANWNVAVTDATGASIGSGIVSFSGSTVDPSTAKITIQNTPSGGAAPLSVVLDFSAVTSFSGGTTSTLQTTSVDGNASGSLSTVTVNATGDVILTYSNNQTKSLGPVAVAEFADPQALKNIGGGLYQNNTNARYSLLTSGSGNAGTVTSSQLETSNVNLTQEFGDLILIQRGYQASSEIISASNDMIQQLFGIRGLTG